MKMPEFLSSLFRNPVLTRGELCSFSRKFAAIMNPVPPIISAIDSISKNSVGKRGAEAFSLIDAEIRAGKTITQAFQKYEPLFGPFFCEIIGHAEAAGNPGVAFLKLSEYYEKMDSFNKKVVRLLRYPMIIMLGATGCFTTLLLFLVPPGLEKASGRLPFALQAAAPVSLFVAVAVLVAALVLALFFRRHAGPAHWFSSLAWYLPFAGSVARKLSLRRFSLALSTLLACGFDVAHALTISAKELRNSFIEKRILNTLVDAMGEPKSIFNALKELRIFPPLMLEKTGHDKSTIDENERLVKIAAFYQDEAEAAINAFAMVISPLFVTVFGLLGLGVLISLYLRPV
jgi:type IV pilus assembly protein PilC